MMKKCIRLILTILGIVSMIGCGKTTNMDAKSPSQNYSVFRTDENEEIITSGAEIKDIQHEPLKDVDWGITLTAKDITPAGLTLVCSQTGVEVSGELNTGSDFSLSKYIDGVWEKVEYLPQEYEIAWTAEAWMIPLDDTVEWEVNWEWLYGKLPEGHYRIGKPVMNLIEPGNFETAMHFAEFVIEENTAKHITIDLSNAKEVYAEDTDIKPLDLEVLSVVGNGVDWANEWYDRMNLSLPMIGDEWNRFYDDLYEYHWIGDSLGIYEKESGNCLYVLEYPTDQWYVNGNNAYLKDGIFYGASVTNGYAQPNSCYMFAYDLNNGKLLWRSADQSYNTMNFIVKGDIIICGYGFTDERDYLYQINRNTGEIIDKMELKKMPDLLVEQDGKLYVHTYSYDYVIEILK